MSLWALFQTNCILYPNHDIQKLTWIIVMSLVSDILHFFFAQIMTSKKWSFPQNILFNPKQTFAAKFCQIDPNVLNPKFCFVQIEFSPTKWLHEGVSVGWSAGWSVYRIVHRFKSDSQNLSNIFFEISYIFCPKINFSSWIALFSQARCFIQYAQIALF